MNKINCILLGPSYKSKGGIASVIQNYLEYSEKGNIIFHFISVSSEGNKMVKLLQIIKALFIMLFYLINKGVKIVHAHPSENNGFYRYIPFFILAKLFRKKIIFHMHGGSFHEFYEKSTIHLKSTILNVLKKCDTIICLSYYWKNYYESIGLKNLSIVPNSAIQPPYNPYTLSNNQITFIGFIEERKGIFDLIHAFSLIADECNNNLHIAGSGSDLELQHKINALGLDKRTVIHGWISVEERVKLLSKTSIFVLPSYFEALPMVLLEAMSYGIPIISTPVGGIPDLIEDGKDGKLVRPGDINALAQTIKYLSENEKERLSMSINAYKKIEQHYSIHEVFNKLNNIYLNVLTK